MAAAEDQLRQVKRHLKLRASLADRLQSKIERVTESGCWIWTGGTTELGYGVIGLGRRAQGTARTHRVSWEIANGPIPEGECVLHRCDVPACCNPAHLFLGSLKDNMRDCVRKGRNFLPDNRGEKASWSRLTKDAVLEIRTRKETGVAYAKRYGVSKSAIYEIWSGNNWKEIR